MSHCLPSPPPKPAAPAFQIAASSKQTQLITGPSLAVGTPCFSRTAVSKSTGDGTSCGLDQPVGGIVGVDNRLSCGCLGLRELVAVRVVRKRQSASEEQAVVGVIGVSDCGSGCRQADAIRRSVIAVVCDLSVAVEGSQLIDRVIP